MLSSVIVNTALATAVPQNIYINHLVVGNKDMLLKKEINQQD